MFTKRAIGLDIADHTLEIIELEQSLFAPVPRVRARGRKALTPGIVEAGRVVLRKQLLQAVTTLMEEALPRPITSKEFIFALPERQVYTTLVDVTSQKGTSLKDAITAIAHESIPLEDSDLITTYRVISHNQTTSRVLLYGASKEVLLEWNEFFESGGFRVRSFDHELLAIVRGLFADRIPKPICVVDIGAERTKIAVYAKSGLHYVHSLEIAGDYFTEQMARSLEVPKEIAEQTKKDQGLEPVKLYVLFDKFFEPIIAEIITARNFYEQRTGDHVVDIILVGGSARLKGLPSYMEEKTGISCRLGSPALPLMNHGKDQDTLHYIEALGLALKGLRGTYWERLHPSLFIENNHE